MNKYIQELEDLISNTFLPVYFEHYRLLGRPSPKLQINTKLLEAMKKRRSVPYLLEKQSYE